jgi:hypothetical protein
MILLDIIYSAHLVVHFTYGFDLLCQTLDQGMTSSVLHFSFLDQVHGPIFCILSI